MKVLLAFSDTSLGGTSRSALEFASLWQKAGAEVLVYSADIPHDSRVRQLKDVNIPLIDKLTPDILRAQTLVHIHHAAPNPKTRTWVKDLVEMLPVPSPAVLTHNIFGQDLGVLFPEGRTLVGLMGHWLAQQYKLQNSNTSTMKRRIVPNPQNLEFFRPPSLDERQNARRSLGIDPSAFVILRVGSPSPEKWAVRPYVKLARRVMHNPTMHLRLVGCPTVLKDHLPVCDRIITVPPTAIDLKLREEYWAADKFAHWAHRGESFGNVITEALGTGLPVIYKSRQLRDNTPWELKEVAGFHYVTTLKVWIRHALEVEPRLANSASPHLQRYASSSLGKVLENCVNEVNLVAPNERAEVALAVLSKALDVPRQPPLMLSALMLLRHNRLTSRLKVLRWRL